MGNYLPVGLQLSSPPTLVSNDDMSLGPNLMINGAITLDQLACGAPAVVAAHPHVCAVQVHVQELRGLQSPNNNY